MRQRSDIFNGISITKVHATGAKKAEVIADLPESPITFNHGLPIILRENSKVVSARRSPRGPIR